MLWMYVPENLSNAATVLGGIGAPPEKILVSVFSDSPRAPGAFISAMNTVIEPTVNVARSTATVSRVTPGSSRYINTSGAPVSRATAMCPTSPVMWNSGAIPSTTSSAPSPTHSR